MMLKGDIYIHPDVANSEHVLPFDLCMVIELMVEPTMMFFLVRIIQVGKTQVVPVFSAGEKGVVSIS